MNTTAKTHRGKDPFLKTKLLSAAVLLLIFALGFNALLTSASLKKLYVESLAASYRVVARDLQQKVQTALSYGKSLNKFVGIDQILDSALDSMRLQNNAAGDIADSGGYAALALADGTILYSSNPSQVGRYLQIANLLEQDETSGRSAEIYTEDDLNYLVALPVTDRDGRIAAAAVIAFDKVQVQALLNTALAESLRTGSVVIISGLLLLWIAIQLLLPRERNRLLRRLGFSVTPRNQDFPRRQLSAALLVMIILCQGAFSWFSASAFRHYYLGINREKVVTLNTLLQRDIEFLLEKGLQLDRLFKLELRMAEILTGLPEVNRLRIVDTAGRGLYQADQVGATANPDSIADPQAAAVMKENPYVIRIELRQGGQPVGYLSTEISSEVMDNRLHQIIIDALTVLVIALLFSVELLMIVFQFLGKRTDDSDQQAVAHYGLIRPAAFLFLFGIDISVSFLPLHMGKLYEPIFGLSRDVVLGLPISVEMFFVMIALYAAGAWIDRRGWREPFLWGLALAGCGVLYSWLAPDALQFILSRAVVGLGYGFALMAGQGFVIAQCDDRTKAQGLAAMFAGVYAGSICGGAAGGMLAERIGYHTVFLIGALIVFLVIGYTLAFIRGPVFSTNPVVPAKPPAPAVPVTPVTAPAPSGRQVLRFLFDRNVFSLVLLSSLPSAIAVVGFLNYFCPIYLNRIGASQSNIGRVFMIYGICLILLAPYVSRFIDASDSKKKFIVMAGLIGGLGFLSFNVLTGYIAVAAVVFMLGLSDSFDQSRNAYALKLKITRELGTGKAFGIFNAASRIGQVVGPFLFGWMLLTVGGTNVIVWFGAFYLVVTLFFLALAQNDRHMTT